MSYYLRVLGEFALYRSDRRESGPVIARRKPLLLVALLATMPERSARRNYVAELVWPDVPLQRARASLRQALHSLSRQLDDPLIESDESRLVLETDRLGCDLWEFDDRLEAGDYGGAVELYGGPFLAGYERELGAELEHWAEAQNERLRAGLDVAYSHVIADALERGDREQAIARAREYADLNPLDERGQARLIRTLGAAGDPVAALQAYWSYRSLLREELGAEPSAELRELASSIEAEAVRRPVAAAPEPASASAPGAERASGRADGEPSRRRVRRWVLAGAVGGGVAALLLGLGLAASLGRWGGDTSAASEAAGAPETLTGASVLHVRRSPTPGVHEYWELSIEDEEVRGRPLELENGTPPGPGGRVAVRIPTERGIDLGVRQGPRGELRVVADDRADESPQDWSPDGRYLLYSAGRTFPPDSEYEYRLAIVEIRTREHRFLDVPPARTRPEAAWSPDGSRIAFSSDPEGQRDVYVVGVDGTGLRSLSDDPAVDRWPAWSPDGQRLAFVSDRTGTTEIFVVSADGEEPTPVTSTGTEKRSPIWLSPWRVAYVAEREGRRDIWVVDVRRGEPSRLTEFGDIYEIRPTVISGSPEPWIERVRIEPRPDVVSPGQWLALQAILTDTAGRSMPAVAKSVIWSVREEEVVQLVGSGWLRVRKTGRAKVIAGLRGWRADTLELVSRPLRTVALEPVFEEDWTSGLDTTVWRPFGTPLPYVRTAGGPEGGGYFVNNGDENYDSGAISRRAFRPDDGITVELWARVPLTRRLHQSFGLRFFGERPARERPLSGSSILAGFSLDARDDFGQPQWRFSPGRGEVRRLTEELDVSEWHRYALQVDEQGIVSLIVDGRLRWRLYEPVEPRGPLYVGLGNRSLGTEIAHGPLRVYPGARYTLEPADVDATGGGI